VTHLQNPSQPNLDLLQLLSRSALHAPSHNLHRLRRNTVDHQPRQRPTSKDLLEVLLDEPTDESDLSEVGGSDLLNEPRQEVSMVEEGMSEEGTDEGASDVIK